MAGVELSVHHLSRMRSELTGSSHIPRFLAGTNYFIDPTLLLDSGGWDGRSLVEDAELGLHVFLSQSVQAKWLPCHEIEQTSPDWKIYIKQRKRWALGHLQLLPIIQRSSLPVWSKARLLLKVLSHFFASPLDLVLPIVSWFLLAHLGSAHEVPQLSVITLVMMVGSLYTWGYLSRGLHAINGFSSQPLAPSRLRWNAVLLMVCMPALALFQLIPRVLAVYQYCCVDDDAGWYKTERSAEVALDLLVQ
jgi:cellulose synthase/poly-beta-1,6-N-acetylglucosamine synthase-like glycosyltransferase